MLTEAGDYTEKYAIVKETFSRYNPVEGIGELVVILSSLITKPNVQESWSRVLSACGTTSQRKRERYIISLFMKFSVRKCPAKHRTQVRTQDTYEDLGSYFCARASRSFTAQAHISDRAFVRV